MSRDIYSTLVYARTKPIIGRLAYYMLKILGVEIPRSVQIGQDIELVHGGFGVVIHSRTVIGDRVKIYPSATVGRADIYLPIEKSHFEGVVIEDDVILCPGCKVLCRQGVMRLGRGSVVGANAVLLNSTDENEIWAGVPARLVNRRDEHDEA